MADKNIAGRCIAALDLDGADDVLEIGPGRGILTGKLLENAGKVVAVEIDPALVLNLRSKFAEWRSFDLVQQDFLSVDLESLRFAGPPAKVIGNLPYAVVSPIIQKVLAWRKWSRAVFMVQKEVGERMLAGPGSKTYGILSIAVQSQCIPKKLFHVPRGCFKPAPNVESMVLELKPLATPLFDRAREAEFFRIVKGAFAHRRKTLLNSLEYALETPPHMIVSALQDAKLSPKVRAETLSIDDFIRLSNVLYNERSK